MHPTIVCFGAAHVDIKAQAKDRVVFGSKNPVSTTMSFGGVARNVAENLSRLSTNVALISRLGDDAVGDLVLAKLNSYGIDTRFMARSTTTKTANFTALIEPHGEMAVALSDMDIYDEITVDDNVIDACRNASMWLVDANLPEDALITIVKCCPQNVSLWALGTSVAKNPRFISVIEGIDVLVVNEQEAETFLRQMPRQLVVTRGARGASLYTNGIEKHFPCRKHDVIDATGAGDAFAAGLAYGFMRTKALEDAFAFAHACARLTLKTYQSVCETLTELELQKTVDEDHHEWHRSALSGAARNTGSVTTG